MLGPPTPPFLDHTLDSYVDINVKFCGRRLCMIFLCICISTHNLWQHFNIHTKIHKLICNRYRLMIFSSGDDLMRPTCWIMNIYHVKCCCAAHIFYAPGYKGLVERRWSRNWTTISCNILWLHSDLIANQYSIRRLF